MGYWSFCSGYDVVTGCFGNAVVASENLNENVAFETGNSISSISSTHAPGIAGFYLIKFCF